MRYEIKELDIGGILDQTIALVKNHFWLFFCITLFLFVPYHLLELFLVRSMLAMMPDPLPPGASLEKVFEHLLEVFSILYSPKAIGLNLLGSLVVIPLTSAAVIHAVACEYLKKPCTVRHAISKAFSMWLPLLGTSILAGLIMYVGFLFCIVPGIFAAFFFVFTAHVVVIEGISGWAALVRSKRLVKGSALTWFVLGLLLGFIRIAIGSVAGAIPQIHLAVIVQTLVDAVIVIFASAAFVVFYFSCRCKTENFDLKLLAEAVGEEPPESPGFGPDPSGRDPNNPWASND